jgi:hypothetical protein
VSLEEAGVARQALLAAAGCARRLARSHKKLAHRFPLTPTTVTSLDPDAEDHLDAFLKRFEQLVNGIQDEVFKAIAVVGQSPRRRRSGPSSRSVIESRTCTRTTRNVRQET